MTESDRDRARSQPTSGLDEGRVGGDDHVGVARAAGHGADERQATGAGTGSDVGVGMDGADRELVELISKAYAAPELSAHRRAELDADLYARIERRRGWRALLAPGLGVAVTAGLIAFLLVPQGFERAARNDVMVTPLAGNGTKGAVASTQTKASLAPTAATRHGAGEMSSASEAGDVVAAVTSVGPEQSRRGTAPATGSSETPAVNTRAAGQAEMSPAVAWEYGLLFSNTGTNATDETDDELALPADYRAIAELFMAG
jgi:hypothetical protein